MPHVEKTKYLFPHQAVCEKISIETVFSVIVSDRNGAATE